MRRFLRRLPSSISKESVQNRVNGHDRFDHAPQRHGTTVLGVKRGNAVALAGDGQITLGDMVIKHGARKVRTMNDGTIVVGFAGAVADALTLLSKFELQLKAWDGNLRKAAVELTKEWRTERYLRRLEAQLLVADADTLLLLSGEGDVIETDDGIAAIGSGSPYATAAARALLAYTDLSAREIAESAMTIAADLCIFTNNQFTVAVVGEDTSIAADLPLPEPTDPADAGSDSEPDEEDA
jgi:ATP-dependent HslUV protease, peptidase subunit HslV